MASRSSSGIGMGVTIAILGVACLALFVLTIVFLSKSQRLTKELADNKATSSEVIKPEEQTDPEVTRLRGVAKADSGRSLVGYMRGSLETTMRLAAGAPRDSITALEKRLADANVPAGTSLLDYAMQQRQEVARLEQEKAEADRSRSLAEAALKAEREAKARVQTQQTETIAKLHAVVDPAFKENEVYRAGIDDRRKAYDLSTEKQRSAFEQERATLGGQLRSAQETIRDLQDQLSRLRGEKKDTGVLGPKDEFALVDGQVIALNQGERQVTINLGRKDRVWVGLPFVVYSDSSAIRRDSRTGEYPPGKATLEIVTVNEDTSICRILADTEVRGNPVVRGDVIANAVFDPKKTYKFLVYGNFDANNDGLATPREKLDIEALVKDWGGMVVNELTGDVDFLVLGSRPLLPPKPRSGDPVDVVREFQRLDREATKYDELWKQATQTGLPLLNENRFYTLTGTRRQARR